MRTAACVTACCTGLLPDQSSSVKACAGGGPAATAWLATQASTTRWRISERSPLPSGAPAFKGADSTATAWASAAREASRCAGSPPAHSAAAARPVASACGRLPAPAVACMRWAWAWNKGAASPARPLSRYTSPRSSGICTTASAAG